MSTIYQLTHVEPDMLDNRAQDLADDMLFANRCFSSIEDAQKLVQSDVDAMVREYRESLESGDEFVEEGDTPIEDITVQFGFSALDFAGRRFIEAYVKEFEWTYRITEVAIED